jgi:hypothetical protein
MENVTCKELWRDWMLSSPENPLVIITKEKISKYSRDDWKEMSQEATTLTKTLGELVMYDIPIQSKIAETAFDNLVDHFNKWFFPITKLYILGLSRHCVNDQKYSQFFDNFYPGISNYISRLVPAYLHKVPQ